MKDRESTIVCLLSPVGRSAVAVIGVAGSKAIPFVESQFHSTTSKKLDTTKEADRILHGHWGDPKGEEVVVSRRTPFYPRGLSGNDSPYLEIHCHGGKLAARQILQSLVTVGCLEIPWQDWLRRYSECLLQAEGRIELAAARTHRTASILLDQCQGALLEELVDLRDKIKIYGNESKGDLDDIKRRVELLILRAEVGLHLAQPWQVVLAGRPNVGKSSLINALLGYTRAIVFDQPGTTRDVLTATTAMDGWPVQLSDTAGLHVTSDPLEHQGMQRAREKLQRANLLVWVLDSATIEGKRETQIPSEVTALAQKQMAMLNLALSPEMPVLVVLNKVDLVPGMLGSSDRTTRSDRKLSGLVQTSATTGKGIDQLVKSIADALVPQAPGRGSPVPFLKRHSGLLQSLRSALNERNYQLADGWIEKILRG